MVCQEMRVGVRPGGLGKHVKVTEHVIPGTDTVNGGRQHDGETRVSLQSIDHFE